MRIASPFGGSSGRPAKACRLAEGASRYTWLMRITLSLFAAGLLSVMMGCGQKGPLVLPDAQRPHKKIGIGKPAQPTPTPAQPAQPAPPGTQPPTPGTQTPGTAASAPQP
jgi:predicted small lipoprotein YifL